MDLSLNPQDKNMEEVPTEAPIAVSDEKLASLADSYGIARDYIAFSGELVTIPLEYRLKILSAMGIRSYT